MTSYPICQLSTRSFFFKQKTAYEIYVLHDLNQLDLRPEAAGFAAVISGHSHVPKQEMKNGVPYFNPGSAGPRRFKLPVSVGRLLVEASKVRGEILQIQLQGRYSATKDHRPSTDGQPST